MKRTGLAAVLTLLFAFAAAGAVFLYVEGARQRAETGGGTVPVVVSTQDVPAGTNLDPLIDQGVFKTKQLPSEATVQGVIQDISQLRGQRTAYPIVANEQITAARLKGALELAGGPLGLKPGMQGWSVTLDPQRVAAGFVQQGDHVEIYGTFSLPGDDDAHVTRVVVEDSRVLWTSAGSSSSAELGAASTGELTLVLEVTPEEAEVLTYSQELASVWMTLLPPNEPGVRVKPVVTRGVAKP